jgi:molecular chaperone GrpE
VSNKEFKQTEPVADGAPEGVGANGPDAEVDSELMDLQYALREAEQEAAEQRDAMIRMQAEMENLRKRLVRDLERSRKRALEDFMNDLLPVLDSFTRGLEVDDAAATVESVKEGQALILRMLQQAMGKHGLVEIDPAGEDFDPELHEAISMLPSAEHPENTVVDVVQKGYRLNDRLVRPARVVVSSGPPQY